MESETRVTHLASLSDEGYWNERFPSNPEALSEGLPELWLQKRNVFERLTDHQFYTGVHRERFDELGNGRGLAGREYVFIHDGMTESANRCHEVFSSAIRYPKKPVVEPFTLGVQAFGVQTITPKLVWLYRNGDKHYQGEPFFVKNTIKSMQAFYKEATKLVKPLAGPVRKMYDQNFCQVVTLEDLVNGAKYLCTSGEPPCPLEKLEKFLSPWIVEMM